MKNKRKSFHGTQHPHAKLKTSLHSSNSHMVPASLSLLATTLLKPKAEKKNKGNFHLTSCVHLPPAICKSCPLLRTLIFHQGSIHMHFPRKPLRPAGECSPSPGPPHPMCTFLHHNGIYTSPPTGCQASEGRQCCYLTMVGLVPTHWA